MLLPLDGVLHRVELARGDSDTTLFLHLLYACEMTIKLVAAGLIAAIGDDRERHQYSLLYRLVRADGIGEWVQSIDEALIGPSSQYLLSEAAEDRRAITERVSPGDWRSDAVHHLRQSLREISQDIDPLPTRVTLRQWFSDFAVLRNKTRAHGATTPAMCARLCPGIEISLQEIVTKLPTLTRSWAYLHKNLSGKYRIVPIGGDADVFTVLKGASSANYRSLTDGVYTYYGKFARVDLLATSVDVSDFFMPNGAYNGRTFELLSYITDNREQGDGTPYTAPAGELPSSVTEGERVLDVVGNVLTNIPTPPTDYISRVTLEAELYAALNDDRHPVITLVGRGGIGKTSLALTVLNKVALDGRFEVIVWFSARDIDLLPRGPKSVAPRVVNQSDIAKRI